MDWKGFLRKKKQIILIALLLFLLILPTIISLVVLDFAVIDTRGFYLFSAKEHYFIVSLVFIVFPFLLIKKIRIYFFVSLFFLRLAWLEILYLILLRYPISSASIWSLLSTEKNKIIDFMYKEVETIIILVTYISLYFYLFTKISRKIIIHLKKKALISWSSLIMIYRHLIHDSLINSKIHTFFLDLGNISYEGQSLNKSFANNKFNKNQPRYFYKIDETFMKLD